MCGYDIAVLAAAHSVLRWICGMLRDLLRFHYSFMVE